MADVDALGLDDGDDGGDDWDDVGDDWVDAHLDWGGDWSDFAFEYSLSFNIDISNVSSGASYADASLAWDSSESAAISASTTMDQGFRPCLSDDSISNRARRWM